MTIHANDLFDLFLPLSFITWIRIVPPVQISIQAVAMQYFINNAKCFVFYNRKWSFRLDFNLFFNPVKYPIYCILHFPFIKDKIPAILFLNNNAAYMFHFKWQQLIF